ncbi:MAG TPA: hypothetical protein VF659_11305 [Pyrinomonadaceae bacterium]|jgi:hypothetical protein
MQRSFAEYLIQFARSVDIVNEDTFEKIRDLIERYVQNTLRVTYFEFMRESTVSESGELGLKTTWATAEGDFSERIRTGGGEYTNQIAYSFDQNAELWVVAKDMSPLASAEEYVDLWSGRTSLPKYTRPKIDVDIHTAIIIPVKRKNGLGLLGVLDFESIDYLEVTPVARRELSLISEALSIISELQSTALNQKESTKKALSELEGILASKYLPHLSKPKLFFAAPSESDPVVVAAIQDVLADYTSKLDVVAWDKISESGNINEQIITEVLSSRYGVCYFSERVERNPEFHFRDNANVLFEARMLHVLSHADQSLSEGWIPIRESDSPAVPFDFASERILLVGRLPDGRLDEEGFKAELRERIDKLIDTRWS